MAIHFLSSAVKKKQLMLLAACRRVSSRVSTSSTEFNGENHSDLFGCPLISLGTVKPQLGMQGDIFKPNFTSPFCLGLGVFFWFCFSMGKSKNCG